MSDIPSQPDPNQCVLGEDGQLKDVKNIAFFHSPRDNNPIPLLPVDGDVMEVVVSPHGHHTNIDMDSLHGPF